jgi:hypothetical protein
MRVVGRLRGRPLVTIKSVLILTTEAAYETRSTRCRATRQGRTQGVITIPHLLLSSESHSLGLAHTVGTTK